MSIIKLTYIILLLAISGCVSTAELYFDEEGRIYKAKYSNNQEIEITKDTFKGNNKAELFKDVVNIQGLKN